ncbi:hypothetical protein [Methanocella arvoryzae]|uniref:hypothetical protein n=1 Tax=Methanocella arvoryzae TaxID=1175445 RepID=UPI000325BDDA|nr:hypothetical protein [Methanocella arvoryzae]
MTENMDQATGGTTAASSATAAEESSIEQEFADLVKYLDLYVRQKTDLYLQHYVFDPFDFLIRQLIYVSVLAALLVAGALALVAGSILFISTLIPLWAALLIIGVVAIVLAAVIAYFLFSRVPVLKTPSTTEMVQSGKA